MIVERLCAPAIQRFVARNWNFASSGCALIRSSVANIFSVSTPLRNEYVAMLISRPPRSLLCWSNPPPERLGGIGATTQNPGGRCGDKHVRRWRRPRARCGGGRLPRRPRRAAGALRCDVRADNPGVGGESPDALVVDRNEPPCRGAGGCALDDSRLVVPLRQRHAAAERL